MSSSNAHLTDDPSKLRDLLHRTQQIANEHGVSSVVVGLAGSEGDLLLSEVFDFLESSLRREDAIFRMTRERVVLFITDVSVPVVEGILDRIFSEFRREFPATSFPEFEIGFYAIDSRAEGEARVKDVLPGLFDPLGSRKTLH